MGQRLLFGAVALGVAVPALCGCGPGGPAVVGSASAAPTTAPAAAAAPADLKAAGRTFVQDVLAALTSGDGPGVAASMCVESPDRAKAPALAEQRPRLRLDPAEIVSTPGFLGADLLGTVDGRRIDAGRIAAFNEGDGWCVNNLWVL